MKNDARVVFHEEGISIIDWEGEIVYWHKDEWAEDPEVVFSIANAIVIALTESPAAVKKLIERKIP